MEKNPIQRFQEVYTRAGQCGLELAEAASLATSDKDGRPSVRVVLLKDYDEEGFVFYTNLKSRKAKDIEQNPLVSLCFWWAPLQEQVRIEGPAEVVSDAEADAYFATRDRESQIGAWASHQSDKLGSSDELAKSFESSTKEFEGAEVPRPPHWGGYRLIPEEIEFWIGKPHRLHERFLYKRQNGSWVMTMLYP